MSRVIVRAGHRDAVTFFMDSGPNTHGMAMTVNRAAAETVYAELGELLGKVQPSDLEARLSQLEAESIALQRAFAKAYAIVKGFE